jgi:hypothetical protein
MARSIMARAFSGLSRNTILLAFASLFADISTEMLYPILPIFLTQTLNASGSAVGLVEGFAQATQNIVQGFSGSLSDRLQRHRRLCNSSHISWDFFVINRQPHQAEDAGAERDQLHNIGQELPRVALARHLSSQSCSYSALVPPKCSFLRVPISSRDI